VIPCKFCPAFQSSKFKTCTEEEARKRALRGACAAFVDETVTPDFE
jgi:hypothetical protein